MSELLNKAKSARFRWQLLTTVSALSLIAGEVVCQDAAASSREGGGNTVWIELGGQLERIGGTGDPFTPDFTFATPTPGAFKPESPIDAQQQGRYGFGGEGKISFRPGGAQWIFSAAVRYGRSNGNKHIQKQTNFPSHKRVFHTPSFSTSYMRPANLADFAETRASKEESHAIADFQAGKDVGLGMFGRASTSTFSFGVRFAQFTSRANVNIKARPDLEYYNGLASYNTGNPSKYFYNAVPKFHAYTAVGQNTRSFHGIGPSVSWDASAPVVGNPESATVAVDWGINASILFGRQKANVSHQTSAHYFRYKYVNPTHVFQGLTHYVTTINRGGHSNSRSVVVPNVGGFVGMSMKFPNSQVSFGYRGDIFFGAMDTGIDARHSSNTSFHGPYAKISIGFGG